MLLFSISRRLAWSRRTSALKTVHFSGSRFSNSFHKLRFKPILGPQPPTSCPFGLVMWRAGRRLWPCLCSWSHPHQAGPLRLERTHRLLSFPPPPGLSLPAVLWSFWKHPTCSHNDHPATSWDGCHSWLLSTLSPHSVDGATETLGILDRAGSRLGSFPVEEPQGGCQGPRIWHKTYWVAFARNDQGATICSLQGTQCHFRNPSEILDHLETSKDADARAHPTPAGAEAQSGALASSGRQGKFEGLQINLLSPTEEARVPESWALLFLFSPRRILFTEHPATWPSPPPA